MTGIVMQGGKGFDVFVIELDLATHFYKELQEYLFF